MFEKYLGHMGDYLLNQKDYHPFPVYEQREEWEALLPDCRNFLLEQGEKYLNYTWPTPPANIYMEFFRNGNRSHYEDILFRGRRLPLLYLVAAECCEGKGRFLDDIINGVWTTLDEATWVLPAHNWNDPSIPRDPRPLPEAGNRECDFVDLFAAECGSVMAWIYYLLGRRLDQEAPQISARILSELDRRIFDPILKTRSFFWMGFLNPHINNWNPWICSNVLTAAGYACNHPEKRVKIIEKIMECLENFIAITPEDGGCEEGPGYWGSAGGSLFDSLELLYDLTGGKVDCCRLPLVQNVCSYVCKAHIDGTYYVNYADAGPILQQDPFLIYRMGLKTGSPRLEQMGSAIYQLRKDQGDVYIMSGVGCKLYRTTKNFFLARRLNEQVSQGFPLLRQNWLPGIQVLYARMQEGSAEGLYLSAKGGNNDESHNHNDIGSFVLYCDGKPAVIDIGSGVYSRSYFNSKRYTIPMMQSQYHNLPIVGGVGQRNGAEYKAENVDCTVSEENCRMHLDIAAAYDRECGILSWDRTLTLDRKTETVTLEDDFRLKEKKDVDFVLMLCKKPTVSGNVMTVPADEASAVEVTFDPSLTPEITVFDVSWDKKLTNIWGTQLYRVIFHSAAPADAGNYRMVFRKKA